MYRVIIIFLSDDMAKIVLKSCETCNASTLLHTPAGDVWPLTKYGISELVSYRTYVNKEEVLGYPHLSFYRTIVVH